MRNVKLVVVLAFVGLVMLFTIQNSELLNVNFLFWSFTTRRAILIFIVFAIGIVAGWILRGTRASTSAGQPRLPSKG